MKANSQSAIQSHAIATELLLQVGSTIRTLLRKKQSAHTVHQTRSTLTQGRASLRLLRKSIGNRTYHRCNIVMRDAGRQLTAARDAEVLVQTVGQLRRSGDSVEMKRSIKYLAKVFTNEHDALRSPRGMTRKSRSSMCAVLRKVKAHSKPLDVVLGEGLVGAYKNCRKAFRRAQKRPTDTNLHEWRKQMKYMFCETEALAPCGRGWLSRLHRHASQMATYLGDDRDLVMLEMRIAGMHGMAARLKSAAPMRELLLRIKPLRVQLQRDAFRLGTKCFSLRPRRFRAQATLALKARVKQASP
jgi:hypothetical protein